MITRLMLSLKKVASEENGWSFSQMTILRRLDESGSMNLVQITSTLPSHDAARVREGFRTRGTMDLEVPTDISEEIGMAYTKDSEGLSDQRGMYVDPGVCWDT